MVSDCALTTRRTIHKLPFKNKKTVLVYSVPVGFAICELTVICGLIFEFQVPLPMLHSSSPLSLIKVGSFFSAVAVDLVIVPFALENSSIGIIKGALPIFLAVPHLPFISLSIAGYEYALSTGYIILPLPQIDIQVGRLKYPCSMFAILLDFSLIGLAVRVLDCLHIFQVLSIGAVYVAL